MEKNNFNFSESDLLLKNFSKKKNYCPNYYFWNKKDNKIPDEHNFEKLFPIFTSFCQNIDYLFSLKVKEKFEEKKKKNYLNNEIKEYIEFEVLNHEKEIINFIGSFWQQLKIEVKRHTSIFFYMVNDYITEKKISEYDKNILFWTILFHDIGKFQKMNKYFEEKFPIYLGLDKTHPFKSIIIFIQSLIKNDLIFFKDENSKKEFLDFYENKFTDAIYKSYENNISFNNFENIEKFLMNLKLNKENEWIYEISVLIIFHQSLPNNDNNMNDPLLDEKYIIQFFDIRLLELMRIIMIYDSFSHSLFQNSDWISQINKHIDIIRETLFNMKK